MLRLTLIAALTLIALFMFGCEKERIIESTEYIQETEYVHLPPDTVTITLTDTVTVSGTDTVTIVNTDTVTVIDTVVTGDGSPNATLAFAALISYSNPLVLAFINAEYGISNGWIFYLNEPQSEVTVRSSSVYDIYGLIDYWTTDWEGFEALEFYWRMSYTGGDPSDPASWQMSEPPDAAPHSPGIKTLERPATATSLSR